MLTETLQRAFEPIGGTLVQAAVWATPSAWLAFSLGAGTTGLFQFLIYFSLPAYVLLLVLGRRPRAGPQNDAPARSSFATD